MNITKITDKLTFGKYKGETIRQVLAKDSSYIRWIIKQNILVFENEIINELFDYHEESYSTGPDWSDLHSDWGDRD